MRVVPVPLSNVHRAVNIADTSGTHLAPWKIREIYEGWAKKGVKFLSEKLVPAELEFEEWRFGCFYDALGAPIHASAKLTSDIGKNFIMAFAHSAFRDAADGRVAFLGGDHSISYHLFREFRAHYGDDCLLIALDAHPDLCNKGKDAPYHSDWLRFVVERDGFDPRRVFAVGWRDAEAAEIEFARSRGIHFHSMEMVRRDGVKKAISQIHNLIWQWGSSGGAIPIYVSVDMDVFDPAIAPGITTPAPCGLMSHEAMELISALSSIREVRAFDLVEVDPTKDAGRLTQLLALKILREMCP